jgi:hypothetical protein
MSKFYYPQNKIYKSRIGLKIKEKVPHGYPKIKLKSTRTGIP